jgi:hypothetical protein
MYNKTEIVKFNGLDGSGDASLINESSARDIMNFRLEKVGKLVSRDGYIIGLFIDPYLMQGKDENGNEVTLGLELQQPLNHVNEQGMAYYHCNGIVGIGEIIFDKKWEWELGTGLDTDRLMVYFVRWQKRDMTIDAPYYGIYLFSPMTGQYKNQLLFDTQSLGITDRPSVNVHTEYDSSAMGMNEVMIGLNAPTRNDDNWIEHYNDMNQYRHSVIISDRTNGDLILENMSNFDDPVNGEPFDNELHLRASKLDGFDIDIIHIEDRFDDGQENEVVKHGMALYKYKLQNAIQETTVDNYGDGVIANKDWLGWDGSTQTDDKAREIVESKLANIMERYEDIGTLSTDYEPYRLNALLNFVVIREEDDIRPQARLWSNFNEQKEYVFTNADQVVEYQNLLSRLEFDKDKYKNLQTTDENYKDGKLTEEFAPDVYIWDDYQIDYKPSSGLTSDSGKFLRDMDRLFDKLTSGTPRATQLEVYDNYGKKVPLGVWRYRFVWDYGDGDYSAPSAEMLVPDTMWSATSDDEVSGATTSNYQRPMLYTENQFENTLCPLSDRAKTEYPNTILIDHPEILTNGWQLTSFGEKFFDLKQKLYSGINHRFGIKDWENYSDVNTLWQSGDTTSLIQLGDFTSLITLKTPRVAKLKGIAWEGGAFPYRQDGATGWDLNWINLANGGMVVPLMPTPNVAKTCISVFDRYGRIRMDWLYPINPSNNYENETNGTASESVIQERPRWIIVMPGYNYIARDYNKVYNPFFVNNSNKGICTILQSKCGGKVDYADGDLYLGVYCVPYTENPLTAIDSLEREASGDFIDLKVSGNDLYLHHIRPSSMIRGVESELDRLLRTKQDIPAEVINRLLLSGIYKIDLCKKGDPISIISEWHEYFYVSSGGTNLYPNIECTKKLPDEATTRNYGQVDEYTNLPNKSVINIDINDVQGYYLPPMKNLESKIYLEGERFIGIEQLTSYFPSSLLFGAPRLGIKIDLADVPRRAKNLMVFRTKSSHSNDYIPDNYGLVETIPIKRVEIVGNADYGKAILTVHLI